MTARELAKMLLITVGGDASRYVGENWDDAVDDDAAAQGIYTRFTKDPSLPVNRDDACLLIYNAMQGLAIEGYDEDGNVEYVMDALRNPISFLEARFGLTRYTGVVTGKRVRRPHRPRRTAGRGRHQAGGTHGLPGVQPTSIWWGSAWTCT